MRCQSHSSFPVTSWFGQWEAEKWRPKTHIMMILTHLINLRLVFRPPPPKKKKHLRWVFFLSKILQFSIRFSFPKQIMNTFLLLPQDGEAKHMIYQNLFATITYENMIASHQIYMNLVCLLKCQVITRHYTSIL